jgi:ketosteroid isomerase-like protein
MDATEKLAIHELLARAVFGLDQRDVSVIEQCFTEDATFILEIKGGEEIPPFVGRDTIMKLMVDAMNAHQEDRRHIVSNSFFEAEGGDTATVVSTLAAFQAEHGQIGVMTSGVYRDTLKKTDGAWRISVRHLALDVPF